MQHLNNAHFADGGNQTWAANASSEYPMNYSIASRPKTGSHLVPPHLHGCRVGLVLLHLFLVFVDVEVSFILTSLLVTFDDVSCDVYDDNTYKITFFQ